MKVIIITLALVALAAAAPADIEELPKILHSKFDVKDDGSFSSSLEADNGIAQSIVGEIKQVLNEKNEYKNILVIHGSFSYRREDGTFAKFSFVSNENGYKEQGSIIARR